MEIKHFNDGRIIASCGGVHVEIPKRLESKIQALMQACCNSGEANARQEIRTALGVDDAIESAMQSGYYNLDSPY